MAQTDWYVQRMNNGRWYVLRIARSTELPLNCERGGYERKGHAEQALRNCLAARYSHDPAKQEPRTMPATQLSPHFTLAEFTYSQTASREGIPNTPTEEAYVNLQRLAGVMEKVRVLCSSQPVQITSGYRGPQLNAAIGGSATSAHMYGLAADFIIPGFGTPLEICNQLIDHLHALGIDQLIWEYADWVHLGLAPAGDVPRCQCLTIDSHGTRVGFA